MKPITKTKWLILLLIIAVSPMQLSAQTKADVFDPSKPITWLGVDYSFAKFIGIHNTQESSMVGNEEFKDVYLNAWNYLFITEQKNTMLLKLLTVN